MSRELPEALADDWSYLREGSVTALVRDDFLDRFRRLGLVEAADRPPTDLAAGARPFRPEGGRGELAVLPAGPRERSSSGRTGAAAWRRASSTAPTC